MKDGTYDFLKNLALILPLVTTFVITIMKIWNIPYATEVGLTLAALNTLVAGVVKIANSLYKKKKGE